MKLNKVIVLLTASDVFTWGLVLVVNAIAGLYLSIKLGVNTVAFIGIGTGIFYIVKGLLQVPIGIYTDKILGDKDDIWFLFFGNVLMGFPFILYPAIQNEYAYYGLQMVAGVGAAMNLVNWRKLFANNLDKGKEGLEYGLYDAAISLTVAFFGILSGLVASLGPNYFDAVMFTIGCLMISSGIWALLIFRVQNRNSQ